MDAKIKLLVVTGDWHCGSKVGLCPRDHEKLEGGRVTLNSVQDWLADCWDDAQERIDAIVGEDEFGVVHMGDAIDGPHGGDCWTIDPEEQRHAAYMIGKTLSEKADKWFQVLGTERHVHNSERTLGLYFAGEKCPNHGGHAANKWYINVNGCLCAFAHHMPATSRAWLESGAPGRELSNEQLSCAKAGHDIPRVVVRAHRHRHGVWEEPGGLMVVSHPWKALDRYCYKVVPAAISEPGFVVLDWRGAAPGALPVVHRHTYTPSPAKAVAL